MAARGFRRQCHTFVPTKHAYATNVTGFSNVTESLQPRWLRTYEGAVKRRIKLALRVLLAVGLVSVGAGHFVDPQPFVDIVPTALPAPLALVYISGVAEILLGIAVVPQRTRSLAGWGTIALLVAVFPANINMLVNNLPMAGEPVPRALLWIRLALQFVFMAWAWWVTRPDDE